jgi:hypothetical protein
VETVKSGTPGANEAAPRSDAPAVASTGDPFARPNAAGTADPNELKPTAEGNELKPSGTPDPNELKPTADAQAAAGDAPLPPPVQINEIQAGQAASSSTATSSSASSSALASDKEISSSKKKKKKGLKKLLVL